MVKAKRKTNKMRKTIWLKLLEEKMLRSSSTMMPNAQLTRHSTKDTQLRMLVESELLLLLTTMIGVWLNNLLLKSQSGGVSEAARMV